MAEQPEMTDEERIRHEIEILRHPWLYRELSAKFRQALQRDYPDLSRDLAKAHPLRYGPDSVQRIIAEFPELFPQAKKPKP